MPSETDTVLFTREQAKKPIVVIVGCGFGGLQAAMHLYKLDIELVLIDRTNHHLFQPLLYQVSTAALAPSDIASPIRSLLGTQPNVSVILGEVDGVDKDAKTVCIKDTGGAALRLPRAGHRLGLRLVRPRRMVRPCGGAEDAARRAADPPAHPRGVRLGGDADRSRGRQGTDDLRRRRWRPDRRRADRLAGRTGARATLKAEYRHIDPSKARIVLVDAAPRILGEFPERLSAYTKTTLEELGVEVMLNTPCEEIDARGITLKGERIETANVFWCAGTKAEPAGDWIGAATAKNGCVEVTADCSVPNHPEIFAIGDVASYKANDGKPLPSLAPVAKQQGAYVAKVIASRIGTRKHPGPFKYTNLGTMAVIGRSHAIAVMFGMNLKGRFAWLAWSMVHLLLLIGFRNRIMVFTNWAWAFFTYGRGSRLVVGKAPQARRGRPPREPRAYLCTSSISRYRRVSGKGSRRTKGTWRPRAASSRLDLT